ncbi:MAG: glucose 1-dehydrogenase [Bacteroidota bacterium]
MNPRIKPLFDLSGKVAIVTGSTRGIGEAMARGLAEFGAKVVITSRKPENVAETTETFEKEGFEVLGIPCHVGKGEQQDMLIAQTIEKWGRLDILVNNAATNLSFGPMEQTEESAYDKIMEINVKAPFELSKKAFPHLSQNGGSIINVSSVEGLKPAYGMATYSMSKSAISMLTQNQAKEWGRYGIRANTVCPGLVKTKLSTALWSNDSLLENYTQNIPLQRMAQPDEMAGIAVFLASEASSYITGGTFTADGGYMIA